MIAKSVGWTTGGPPSRLDPAKSANENLGPDEVLVKIAQRKATGIDLETTSRGDDPSHEPQRACRGVAGRVMEAGANALWYVDRAVIIPAGGRCADCDTGQRDRAMARFEEESAEGDDGTTDRFVVMRANELCVVSTIVDWQKPT